MASPLQRSSGWSVCRNFREIPVPHVDVLPMWAERGRLLPDDYLANAKLEVCFQARDVPELNEIFRRLRPFARILRMFSV